MVLFLLPPSPARLLFSQAVFEQLVELADHSDGVASARGDNDTGAGFEGEGTSTDGGACHLKRKRVPGVGVTVAAAVNEEASKGDSSCHDSDSDYDHASEDLVSDSEAKHQPVTAWLTLKRRKTLPSRLQLVGQTLRISRQIRCGGVTWSIVVPPNERLKVAASLLAQVVKDRKLLHSGGLLKAKTLWRDLQGKTQVR